MGVPNDCPLCRLVNPPDARRCDCGYDFVARRHVGSLLTPSPPLAFGAGTALLLAAALVTFGALLGAAVGVTVQMWQTEPVTAQCGLWILPVVAEGLIGGAVLGGLSGTAAAPMVVWMFVRRSSPIGDRQ